MKRAKDKYMINRTKYKDIKRYDHKQMEDFLTDVCGSLVPLSRILRPSLPVIYLIKVCAASWFLLLAEIAMVLI